MADHIHLFVGALNRKAPYFQGANGVGLSLFRFDDETGAAELVSEVGDVDNPSYLTVDPKRRTLYAVSEVFGWKEGIVTAYRYDLQAGRLDYINMQPALGSISCYASLADGDRVLLIANYAMGEGGPDQSVVVLPIRGDGGLLPPVGSVAHRGTGPNKERQERSHAHCALQVPGTDFVLVADLGIDQVLVYRLTGEGQLEKVGSHHAAPGAGPRHIALHPTEPLVFVINELGSTVSSLRFGMDGSLTEIATVSTLPEGATMPNDSSDLQISPDGRFLYGCNRGHDSVAILSVDATTGALAPVGHVPCGGSTPRNCGLSPSGRHLLVANQNADVITVFRRNAEDGSLTDTGNPIRTGTPMCVKFVAG
ncbi:MAG TPA: lactonase family protein [Geminicoccus sp.]|uniref:lactonase family protein n=1 Tax=Geminicoccus sp. TaxID=2024832 RepID=UPI002E337520|nr:lactonase family protein [Geminicoccus sp.]HEX2524988.1 lactonase family protein [Geminicoccus sp.]